MGDKKLEIVSPMHCEGPSFTHALSWMGPQGQGQKPQPSFSLCVLETYESHLEP